MCIKIKIKDKEFIQQESTYQILQLMLLKKVTTINKNDKLQNVYTAPRCGATISGPMNQKCQFIKIGTTCLTAVNTTKPLKAAVPSSVAVTEQVGRHGRNARGGER